MEIRKIDCYKKPIRIGDYVLYFGFNAVGIVIDSISCYNDESCVSIFGENYNNKLYWLASSQLKIITKNEALICILEN